MDASDILAYITTTHFGKGVWQTNAQGFVDNWQNQFRLYERITDNPSLIRQNMSYSRTQSRRSLNYVR